MSATDNGGPAFPVLTNTEGFARGLTGMTLRDYFAITLLAGDAATTGEDCDGYMEQRARVAYAYADFMLAARSKT